MSFLTTYKGHKDFLRGDVYVDLDCAGSLISVCTCPNSANYIHYLYADFVYQLHLTSCFKKYAKTTSSHPHNSQTIHTQRRRKSTTHTTKHIWSNPTHKTHKKKQHEHSNPSTHVLQISTLHGLLLALYNSTFPTHGKTIAIMSNTAAPVSCDYWRLEI